MKKQRYFEVLFSMRNHGTMYGTSGYKDYCQGTSLRDALKNFWSKFYLRFTDVEITSITEFKKYHPEVNTGWHDFKNVDLPKINTRKTFN